MEPRDNTVGDYIEMVERGATERAAAKKLSFDPGMAIALNIIAGRGPQHPDAEILALTYRDTVTHLRGKVASLEADRDRLNHLDTTRYDLLQHVPGRGDPDLVGYAWGIQGQCRTIREAVDAAPSLPQGTPTL